MTDQTTNIPSSRDWLKDASTITGIVWLLGGICYITGYLIVNIYLSQFAVSYLNLIQTRYFATGLLFMIVNSLVFAGPILSAQVALQSAANSDNKRPATQVVGLLVANLLLVAALIWVIGLVLTEVDRYDPFAYSIEGRQLSIWVALPMSQAALLFPFLVIGIVRRIMAKQLRSAASPTMTRAAFGGLFAICALISLFVFAVAIYPNTSPSFGGGAPSRIQLLVKKESPLSQVGIVIVDGVTESLILLDQTQDKVLLLTKENQTIELSADELSAIIRDNR